jgi:glycosyltransferase involved in cell wall biosynthesis
MMRKKQKNKFNILFISSFGDLKGGGQRSLLLLLKNLDKTNFLPVIVVPEHGELEQEAKKLGIEVIVLNFPRIRSINLFRTLSALLELKAIVKNRNIDLIHTDSPRETFYAGIIRIFMGVRVILHLRVSDKVRWIDQIVYKLTDKMIAVSKSLTTRFAGIDTQKKINVVYNAVDIDEFKPIVNKNTEKNILRLGYFGRIVKRRELRF